MPGCCARGPGRSPGARSPRNISASAAARGRAGRHPPGGSPLSLPCPPFDGCRSELLRARAGLDDERPRLPAVLGGAETLGPEEAQMPDVNLQVRAPPLRRPTPELLEGLNLPPPPHQPTKGTPQ